MAFVQDILSNPTIPEQERERALDRAFSDPGIPDPRYTTSSFWMRQPHPELSGLQSPTLPTNTNVVIIGSGITATSIAKTILESGHYKDIATSAPGVVILDARDICSGATGRNGGHILETAEEFASLEHTFGLLTAKKIIRMRLAHLNELLAIAEEYRLVEQAQIRKVQFLSAYFDKESWILARKSIERFKVCMPEESVEWRAVEKEDIPKSFCLPHAMGIITGPAGAVWPYKLITGILSHLRQKFLHRISIETNTPVIDINRASPSDSTEYPYPVITPRGIINSRHVIHCTNAHIGHLVPGLRGCIFPVRGQMSAQTPGQNFPFQGTEYSWIFNYKVGFDYVTQLPCDQNSNGEMMLGGGFAQGENGGASDLGISTDSGLSLYADIHLSGVLSAVFGRENWGVVPAPSVKNMWTGNMGFSADGLPWVGRLPYFLTQRGTNDDGREKGAEWACAAFSGEGMVQAWLCGKAVGLMLSCYEQGTSLSACDELSWFPEEMLVSEKRVKESVLQRSRVVERKKLSE